MKLGSLFSGSGGFELAGAMNGIEPIWASEIEPYPIRVTSARFPHMKHLGDITKIDGSQIEPVDIVCFGSPCQDISTAGKMVGLQEGRRSSLFFEAIRIIKEMRDATNGEYPKYVCFENVPGIFSSNKGEDFRSALESFCSIKGGEVSIPLPEKGKWQPAGAIMGDGYTVAWRTVNSAYWGTPQRRRRVYALINLGDGSLESCSLLFEQESMPGNSPTVEGTWENASRYVARSPVGGCE